jgi:hypothetical protein
VGEQVAARFIKEKLVLPVIKDLKMRYKNIFRFLMTDKTVKTMDMVACLSYIANVP